MHSQKGHNLYYDGSKPYSKFTYSGINILSHHLDVQLRKVAHATQTFFSSDTLLRMCHNASSTTVGLSVFISLYVRLFQQLVAAYGKALNTYFSVSSSYVWFAPTMHEYCRDWHATVFLRSWRTIISPINMYKVCLIMWRCELIITTAGPSLPFCASGV